MANSVSVNSVTLKYSMEEDRLFLRCKVNETEHYAVWWTMRLWLRVFPALVEWLEKQTTELAAPTARQFQAQAQQRADETLVLNQKRNTQESSTTPSKAQGLATSSIATVLCSKVELGFQKSRVKIQMVSSQEDLSIAIQMNREELRQFLLAQARCLKASDWTLNIPDWLLPEMNTSTSTGAPLH